MPVKRQKMQVGWELREGDRQGGREGRREERERGREMHRLIREK